MKLQCAIVDNETAAIDILKRHIALMPQLELTASWQDPVQALSQLNTMHLDLLFLDIDMPHLDGLELSRLIPPAVKVVFTTAFPNFALDAFDANVLDYLLKPVSFARFQKCLNKINYIPQMLPGRIPAGESFFYLKSETKGKMIKIDYKDIFFIESFNNYLVINLAQAKHKAYLSLRELGLQLPETIFYRIHKSFIINLHQVQYIDGNQILLKDKSVLQIGHTYREDFFKLVDKITLKSYR